MESPGIRCCLYLSCRSDVPSGAAVLCGHGRKKMIKPHTGLLAIFYVVTIVGCAGISSRGELNLVSESYMIQSRDPGIQLHVRNKRPESMTQFNGERTLLYVHGTTQAASSTFDLPLDGLSW